MGEEVDIKKKSNQENKKIELNNSSISKKSK